MPEERIVTHTIKDNFGDIIAVGNDDQIWYHFIPNVISEIKNGSPNFKYLARDNRGNEIEIGLYDFDYLRTDPDASGLNNLENLPSFELR